MWDAGIPVVMGTDAGNIGTLHGPSVFREMALMTQAGLTSAAGAAIGDVDGAKAMGLANDIGAVAPGKLADLVLLDADPLADVANLARAAVIKGGKVFEPAALMRSISTR